ncbi:MAG: carbohydrate ABC transporter permease [Dehalococcoidia bacterium]
MAVGKRELTVVSPALSPINRPRLTSVALLNFFRRWVLLYAGATIFFIIAVFLIYWMVITAFKKNDDLYNVHHFPLWFNSGITFSHLDYLFSKTHFSQWLANSYMIGAFTVAITLIAAVPAGYALARMNLPFSGPLSIGIFLTYLVPASLLFIPLSRVVADLGLQNSIWALIVVYPTFTIPFCTWLMMGFFKTVPIEIEEAAMIDGCGAGQAIWHVMLPISRAGILSVVIFAFTLAMQDFVYALTFISTSLSKPVTLGVVTDLVRGDVFYWGELMAGALIAGVPVAILYNFFLDEFISGITAGAIK